MTENGIVAIITLIVGLLTSANGLFTFLTNRGQARRTEALKLQSAKQAELIQNQNLKQTEAITEVREAQVEAHGKWNGRLDEWKKAIEEQSRKDINAAVARGIIEGIEIERTRSKESAADIRKKAEIRADNLTDAAAKIAEEVLDKAKTVKKENA